MENEQQHFTPGTWKLGIAACTPLSLTPEPGRAWPQGPAGGGQRAAPRHLGAFRAALWASTDTRDLRDDRGQRGYFQLHGTARGGGARFLALQGERQEEHERPLGQEGDSEKGGP